ncbi:MAG: hypothetical protein WBF66_09830 [Dehalococcoidia bacterium]
MFYSTPVRENTRSLSWSAGEKEPNVQFFVILSVVMVLAAVYLVHQWYTGELAGSSPFDDGDAA